MKESPTPATAPSTVGRAFCARSTAKNVPWSSADGNPDAELPAFPAGLPRTPTNANIPAAARVVATHADRADEPRHLAPRPPEGLSRESRMSSIENRFRPPPRRPSEPSARAAPDRRAYARCSCCGRYPSLRWGGMLRSNRRRSRDSRRCLFTTPTTVRLAPARGQTLADGVLIRPHSPRRRFGHDYGVLLTWEKRAPRATEAAFIMLKYVGATSLRYTFGSPGRCSIRTRPPQRRSGDSSDTFHTGQSGKARRQVIQLLLHHGRGQITGRYSCGLTTTMFR